MRLALAASLIAALLGGCSWVGPSTEALHKDIAVLDAGSVGNCRLMSHTDLTVGTKLGNFQRMPADIQHDLQTLAINQAAAAGDDTIAALSPIVDGKQTYGLYVCGQGNLAGTAAPAAGTVPAEPAITAVKTMPYNPPY